MDFNKKFALLSDEVRAKLDSSPGCHDFDHVKRVMHNADELLASEQSADGQVVKLAALLHDIARPEEFSSGGELCHATEGAEIAFDMLIERGFDEELAHKVAECVKRHRFRSRRAMPRTIEEKIVYDADKLDSLGAVGIGRAFLFAGNCNARLHNSMEEALNGAPYGKEDSAYREYLVKLKELPQKLLTKEGKRIGMKRGTFMDIFFRQLETEINGHESGEKS